LKGSEREKGGYHGFDLHGLHKFVLLTDRDFTSVRCGITSNMHTEPPRSTESSEPETGCQSSSQVLTASFGCRCRELQRALSHQRVMPTAKATSLPVDSVNRRRDDLGAFGSEFLYQIRHIFAYHHRLFVQDKPVAPLFVYGVRCASLLGIGGGSTHSSCNLRPNRGRR
jgi:hypothetical protein